MQFWSIIFVLSLTLVFYNYAGYAIIVACLNFLRKKHPKNEAEDTPFSPTVSFIVAAYNEEDFIEKKIRNSLEQDYPVDKIEFIFITDGSTDGTTAIIGRYPPIRLLHQTGRSGKSAAVNRAVDSARGEILIFSDANTTLNKEAVRNIVRHYRDSRTGGVAGEKKVMPLEGIPDEAGAGEGLYWKYESFLKKIDARFYSVVGAAGELFSVRREHYQHLSPDVILDDFVLSLQIAQKGYRIAYEPEAFAMELPSISLKEERKRKVRISAGGFQSIGILWRLLLFWRQPRLSFLYISHRVLRWTLSPLCLILALVSNIALCLGSPATPGGTTVYWVLLTLQLLFYTLAALASIMPPDKRPSIIKLPYYFTFMNVSVVWGFFRFLRGRQSGVWEKASRASHSIPSPK
ncbi:MAG: glycosyltransferase family 2 protein [Chitinophagaceae bacterium]|nr:glycosyltransferase family 2 protein [Chitinophagaceae bacterium]